MLAARRSLLLICLLLAPLLSMLLIRATSHAQPALTSASASIVPVADVPRARGVAIDAAGNLFSIDRDTGTVYKITPGGQVSTLVDLPDIDNGYIGPVFDPASGNLFVNRFANGTGNQVFKITLAGVVSVFATGIEAPSGLAADGQGNLFVTSYTCPGGAIYKVTSTGVVSLFGTGLCHPDGVAIGPNGDLFIGDRGTHRIMRISAAGGVATIFATGFTTPIAVVFNQTGTLFVADYSTGIISSVNPNGVVSPFASGLNVPSGLVFDQQNQLYVANSGSNQIVRLENPGWIATIASVPKARGVTTDTAGNLYALATDAGTVYKITPGGQISTIADLPDISGGYIGPVFDPASGNLFVGEYDLGTGNQVLKITLAGVVSVFATVASPSGLAADGQGNLFVTSYTCPASVYKITSTGVVSLFGTGLCHPDGVAIGPNGDLFIGDRGTQRIMRIPAAGGAATVFATGFTTPIAVAFDQTNTLFVADYSTGVISSVDANGVVSPFASRLLSPSGLVFDQQNQLYVANSGSNQVVKLTNPAPNIAIIAGVPRPRGVTFDTGGNLYSLAIDAGTVYKITPAGAVSTLADLPDIDNGYGGPVFDPASGNLFVSQYANGTGNQVFKITLAGVVSVFATGIDSPGDLAADGQGNLLVVSYTCPGGAVYKISSTGAVSLFGTGLCHSNGMAIGPNGDLFIGDSGTRRIMRVPAAGGTASAFATGITIPIAVAFNQAGQLFATDYSTGIIYAIDSNGGISPFASGFYLPAGLAFDQQNQLYLADLGNHKVVRVDDVSVPLPTPTATPSPTATATPTATPTNVPPPIADRLTINGGALTTTSVNVRLDVFASNADGSQAGLSMSFSNDGATWSDWVLYDASSLWQLTQGDGIKTVYGRFKNSGGAISAIISDTITLDTGVQSEYGVTINNGALYTNRVAVQLKISARPRTAEMQVSNDGGFDGAVWEPYSAHKAWQITAYGYEEITRHVYVRFRDVDGNVSTASDDIILDLDPPHGQVSIADQGALLELAATDDVSGVADMRMSAQSDFDGASWEPFVSSRAWDFGDSPTVYVQFRDNAGNLSPSYTASLTGTSTVFLPLVLR